MNDKLQPTSIKQAEIKQAEIKPMQTISRIWIVPIITALLGLWMVYYYYSQQGPLITIELNKAAGLEAGVTKIKFRDVQIGKVEKIILKDTLDGVLVTARMTKEAKKLLVSDSKFWVVSTKINHSGISDLSTLFSGNYIELQPGKSSDESNYFKGLPERPITAPDAPGIHVTLNSNEEFAFKSGAPILYKGLKVGQIEDVYFNFKERMVYYNAFINAPYHQLLTDNTRFWDISGIRVNMKAQGISIKTGSLETLLTNGITFGIPEGMSTGHKIKKRAYFNIFPSYEAADAARYLQSVKYVLLVKDSVRGLDVGAPVEYKGVTVGRVDAIDLPRAHNRNIENSTDGINIDVVISIQPGRIGLSDTTTSLDTIKKQINRWLEHGLKAKITMGNLLTGSKIIELGHTETDPTNSNKLVYKAEQYRGYRVIPTEPNTLAQLIKNTSNFIEHLTVLPLDKLTNNANQLLTEFTITAKSLHTATTNLNKLLTTANQKDVIKHLNTTLQSVTKVANGFTKGSKTYTELTNMLLLLQENLQELKPLIKQLNNKPNSLIFNGSAIDNLQPKKAVNQSKSIKNNE